MKDANVGKLNSSAINNKVRLLQPNELNKYTTFNYVWTLSAMTPLQVRNPKLIFSQPPFNIVARSAGIGTKNTSTDFGLTAGGVNAGDIDDLIILDDASIRSLKTAGEILNQNKDIYFERVIIDSVARPNQERGLMNFTKIEMTLAEPMGITLWEKIRAAAGNSGYVNHTVAPFLLTLEFRGYDSSGNPVPSKDSLKRYFPIRLTRSDVSLKAGGSTYTLYAQPWTEFAMVNSFLYTRGSGEVGVFKARTFDEVFKKLEEKLDSMQQEEVKKNLRQIADKYLFTIDSKLAKDLADYTNNNRSSLGFFENLKEIFGAKFFDLRDKVSLAKVLEDFIKQAPKFKKVQRIVETYWKDVVEPAIEAEAEAGDNNYKAFNNLSTEYVDWFKIITSVEVRKDEFDAILATHPYKILFHVAPYKIHILNFVRAGMGGLTSWGKYVKKKFDYIYTGENTEILDLDISYNAGYYNSRLKQTNFDKIARVNLSKYDKVQHFFGAYGQGYPEPTLPLTEGVTTVSSKTSTALGLDDDSQIQEFYDYLTNPKGDMVQVEMKIMGDPAFIGQDLMIPLEMPSKSGVVDSVRVGTVKGLDFDPQLGCFNFDRSEPIVQLNFLAPSDLNENTGLYDFTSQPTPQFNGLYRVNRVESIFDGGRFTQNLQMTRYNNQRGSTNLSAITKIEDGTGE